MSEREIEVAERVGFEHFGRSMRISILAILQGTSFPYNPLRSPYFPPDLPPAWFIRFGPAQVGCEHALGLALDSTGGAADFFLPPQNVSAANS
jgi:hypothetical protein